jgi:hypothetical protein
VESSQWSELAVHPTTGEKKLFQADTQEDLDRQIAAWTRPQTLPSPSRSREPGRAPSEDLPR